MLSVIFVSPPYFDHDAFMHHTMHVLDAPVCIYVSGCYLQRLLRAAWRLIFWLFSFIRLVDYLIVSTMQVLAVNSITTLLNQLADHLQRTPTLAEIQGWIKVLNPESESASSLPDKLKVTIKSSVIKSALISISRKLKLSDVINFLNLSFQIVEEAFHYNNNYNNNNN